MGKKISINRRSDKSVFKGIIDRLEAMADKFSDVNEEIEKIQKQKIEPEIDDGPIEDYNDDLEEQNRWLKEELDLQYKRAREAKKLNKEQEAELKTLSLKVSLYKEYIEDLKILLKDFYQEALNTDGFDSDGFVEVKEIFDKLSETLKTVLEQFKDIKTVLGTIDDNNGLTNIVKTLNSILKKLDGIRGKIGTGVYNIDLSSKGSYGSNADKYIDQTIADLRNRYEKVVEAFGDEDSLFQRFGIESDDFKSLYGKTAVNSLTDPKLQIDRIREFFKEFRKLRDRLKSENDAVKKDIQELLKSLGLSEKELVEKGSEIDKKGMFKNALSQEERILYNRIVGYKADKKLVERLDRVTAPAKNNARMNKRIEEIQDAENEEARKIQELAKPDLSGVVQVLGDIQSGLTNILELLQKVFSTATEGIDNINTGNVGKKIKDILVYRGTNGDNPMTSNASGATFWSSKKENARLYGTNADDKSLYSALVSMDNALEIDAKGAKYGHISYLGDGADEASKKIIELTNKAEECRKELVELQSADESDSKAMQRAAEVALEYQKALIGIKEISDDLDNPYGTHSTDWFGEYAKNHGYDGVHFKNVRDTPDAYTEDVEPSDVYITFQKEQLKNIQLLERANHKLSDAQQEVLNETPVSIQESDVSTIKAAEEVAKNIAENFHVSDNTVKKLKDDVVELFKALSRGEELNLDNIFKALSNTKALKQANKGDDVVWQQIRDYISKSKIKLTRKDRDELGDDFNAIRSTIGMKNYTIDANATPVDQFFDELRGQFGSIIPDLTTTTDMLRWLYEYLSNPPKKISVLDQLRGSAEATNMVLKAVNDGYSKLQSDDGQLEKSDEAIKHEGEAADKAAQQEKEFVSANNEVAKSGERTAESINEAADAIKKGGDAVSESKIDVTDFEKMVDVSENLKEQLGGVVDVYKQIRKDSDGNNRISYRLVGKNGYAWVGENGNVLNRNIKIGDSLAQQKEQTKRDKELENLVDKVNRDKASQDEKWKKHLDRLGTSEESTELNASLQEAERLRKEYDAKEKEQAVREKQQAAQEREQDKRDKELDAIVDKANRDRTAYDEKWKKHLSQLGISEQTSELNDELNNAKELRNKYDQKTKEEAKETAEAIKYAVDTIKEAEKSADNIANKIEKAAESANEGAEKYDRQWSEFYGNQKNKKDEQKLYDLFKEADELAANYDKKVEQQHKQLKKDSSDRIAAKDKARQEEINRLLKEQKGAYQEVLNIRKEIAKLNPDDNAEEIARLEEKKKTALQTYQARTKELKAIDETANAEAQVNTLLEMRKRNLQEIAVIEGKSSDKAQSKLKKTYDSIFQKIDTSEYDLDFELKNGNHTAEFNQELSELLARVRELKANPPDIITQKDIDEAKELSEEIRQIRKSGSLTANKQANENSIQKGLAQINSILSGNTKSAFRRTDVYKDLVQLQTLFKSFDASKPQSELAELTTNLLKVKARFEELDETVKGAGFFQTFTERLRGINAQLLAQYFSWHDIIRYGRTMVSTIIELDSSLLDLRKTTTMNATELDNFYHSASDVAKGLGVTTNEIITQASAWSRLNNIGPLCGNT